MRRPIVSSHISKRQADNMREAFDHAIRLNAPLTHCFNINWKYGSRRGEERSFEALQRILHLAGQWLERRDLPIHYIAVRERPSTNQCEGAHIALHIPSRYASGIEHLVRHWGGQYDPRFLSVTRFNSDQNCNARSFVLGYMLKGGSVSVRERFPAARNKRWGHSQGVLARKRVLISYALSAKARRTYFDGAPRLAKPPATSSVGGGGLKSLARLAGDRA